MTIPLDVLADRFPDWRNPQQPEADRIPLRCIRAPGTKAKPGRPRSRERSEIEAGRDPICAPALERLRARKRAWYHNNKARKAP